MDDRDDYSLFLLLIVSTIGSMAFAVSDSIKDQKTVTFNSKDFISELNLRCDKYFDSFELKACPILPFDRKRLVSTLEKREIDDFLRWDGDRLVLELEHLDLKLATFVKKSAQQYLRYLFKNINDLSKIWNHDRLADVAKVKGLTKMSENDTLEREFKKELKKDEDNDAEQDEINGEDRQKDEVNGVVGRQEGVEDHTNNKNNSNRTTTTTAATTATENAVELAEDSPKLVADSSDDENQEMVDAVEETKSLVGLEKGLGRATQDEDADEVNVEVKEQEEDEDEEEEEEEEAQVEEDEEEVEEDEEEEDESETEHIKTNIKEIKRAKQVEKAAGKGEVEDPKASTNGTTAEKRKLGKTEERITKRRRKSIKEEPVDTRPKRSGSPVSTVQNQKRFQSVAVGLINSIQSHRYSSPFLQGVSDKNEPDYKKVIKEPKDLKNILKAVKLKGDLAKYHLIEQLERDIMLMLANCIMYNKSTNDLVKLTKSMKDDVDNIFKLYKEANTDP